MPYCPHCGQRVTRCTRRSPLCRWLCDGWEHVTGPWSTRHECTTRGRIHLAAAEDISDLGPGWETWRELRDTNGLDPWGAAA